MIASSVGDHAFYVYDSAHLNLAYMSKYIAETITCLQATSDGYVYTALQSEGKAPVIACWKKMKVLEFEGHTKSIIKFIAFGDFLFSLAEEGEFLVFNRMKGTIIKRVQFESHFDNFLHPSTYVNKLVFSLGNQMELWNIMTEQKVFSFEETIGQLGNVTCIEQSPVVDVAAVGFEDGTIVLLNLLYN